MGIKTKEKRFFKALLYRLDRIHISAVPRTIQICHMLYSHGQKYVRISQMQNVHWPIGIHKQVRKSSWVNQLQAQRIRVGLTELDNNNQDTEGRLKAPITMI